jgi:hypothetical protein
MAISGMYEVVTRHKQREMQDACNILMYVENSGLENTGEHVQLKSPASVFFGEFHWEMMLVFIVDPVILHSDPDSEPIRQPICLTFNGVITDITPL